MIRRGRSTSFAKNFWIPFVAPDADRTLLQFLRRSTSEYARVLSPIFAPESNFRACRLVPPRSLTAQCQHPSLDVTQWICAFSLMWSGVHSTRDSWGKLDAVRLRAPRVLRTESKVDGERR